MPHTQPPSTAGSTRVTLDHLNAAPADPVAALLAPVFEDAPWVTAGLAAQRPFASVTALHTAAMDVLRAASPADQVAFLRGHPALSPATLARGAITPESVAEQTSAGIATMDAAAAARLDAANAAHSARFGFPFIIAVRHATLPMILGAMERRAAQDPAAELAEALREVGVIAWLRLLDRIVPATTGSLSLHVLDTARTRPAAGLHGQLWGHAPGAAPALLDSFQTDAQGRAGPMLAGGALQPGGFEWRLDTAAYNARNGLATPDRSFLPVVSVRFQVTNPEEHFHVPVLLSTGSYTTYRGS